VEGVLPALRRRPVAGIGLVLAVAWVVLVAYQCVAVSPWNQGGSYSVSVTAADLAMKGIVGIAAFVWLVERAEG
jgi:hypothetical protein